MSAAAKLTVTQREVLERLITRGPSDGLCVNPHSARALAKRGFVRCIRRAYALRDCVWVITPEGREAGMAVAWDSDPRR